MAIPTSPPSRPPRPTPQPRSQPAPIVPLGSNGWTIQASTGYNLADFYCRATDNAGHADVQRLKIKPEFHNTIQALVASRHWPAYRTAHDFYRDAAVHRLHWLEENADDPTIREHLSAQIERITFANFVAEAEATIREWTDLKDKISSLAVELTKQEDWFGLRELLNETREQAEGLREPYSSRILEIVSKHEESLPFEWRD